MLKLRTAAAAVAVLLISQTLGAQSRGQTTGDIRGTTVDASGAPLPGVTVSVVETASELRRSATSSASGRFELALLPPGRYDVTCALAGFAERLQRGIGVAVGSVAALDCVMTAALSETVEVSARAALVEPGRTQNAFVVGPERIAHLPINERDFLSFSLTVPGVNSDRAPQLGAAANSGLSFSGQSARYNDVLVDGLDNNDFSTGSVRSTFSQEAVQEFQVLTSSFAAEYGRALGGVVNIVTKSGTNTWGGSLFAYDREDGLDAPNALAPSGLETPHSRRQFGASLGGPLVKDRTFLFAAVERLALEDTNVVSIDPAAAAVIRAAGFPLETGALPFERDNTTAFLRLDHRLTPGHTLTARYNFADGRNQNQEPWGGLLARSRGGAQDTRDHTLSLGLSSVLGPRLLHEARVLYARREIALDTLDPNGGPNVRILGVAELGRELNLPHTRTQDQLQVVDTLNLYLGAHAFKAGLDVNHTAYETSVPNVLGGLQVFAAIPQLGLSSSLAAFQRGLPALTLQSFGDSHDAFDVTLLGGFLQDDWRLGRGFKLQLGLRYDREDLPEPFPSDGDNLAPRLGLAWTSKSTRTNLHAGYGRYYAATSIAPIIGPRLFGSEKLRLVSLSPPATALAWAQPGHRFAADPHLGLPSVFRMSSDFQTSFTDQASVGLEQALSKDLALNLAATGARGRHILVARNINTIDAATRRRPDPGFQDITLQESTGDSWYRGLTAALAKRSGAVQFQLSYTLSKAEDDYIDWFGRFGPQDKRHPELDKGPSFQDERHRLVLSGLVDLPRFADTWLLDGWSLGAIASYGSGRPFNVLSGFDRNGDGDATSDRPAGVRRNSGKGPSFLNVDLRVTRQLPLGGKRNAELTFEVFNLFDRANFSKVNEVFGPGPQPLPAFGQPVEAFAPRQIQLGARVSF